MPNVTPITIDRLQLHLNLTLTRISSPTDWKTECNRPSHFLGHGTAFSLSHCPMLSQLQVIRRYESKTHSLRCFYWARHACTDLACFIGPYKANGKAHSAPNDSVSTVEHSLIRPRSAFKKYSASCTRGSNSAPMVEKKIFFEWAQALFCSRMSIRPLFGLKNKNVLVRGIRIQ